jgi:hypothetical protein
LLSKIIYDAVLCDSNNLDLNRRIEMRKYIAMPLALFRVSLAIVVLLLTVSCTSLPNNSISYSAEWDRELVDGKAQLPRALIRTSDGGYAVAGYGPVELVPGGVGVGVGFWTVKLDQNGKVLWQRAFAADAPKREEGAYTLAETRDGGVLVVGMTQSDSLAGQSLGATADPSSGTRGRLGFLIAYGKDGALLWKKTLPSADRQPSDWFFAASTVADGYLLAGMSITLFENSSFHSGKRAAYVLRILKLDLQGNVVWDRAVPDGEYSIMHLCVANKIVLTPDGGFLVAISSGDDDGDRAKMDIVSDDGKVLGQSLLQRTVLVKFDHHGQLIKRAEFSAATEHIALGANADGYIVSGHEELLWYAFFDNDLNLKWKRAFVMPVWINSFWPAPDGGFYGAGMISQAAIAHISPTGELSQQIIHGMPDGSEGRDIAPGDRPDEFVVLWNRIVRTRAGLVKLRVPLQQIHAPH